MTAAKDLETLHRISSQNAKSEGSKVCLTKSESRLDLSGLMYRSEMAENTSSMCRSCDNLDSLWVLSFP